MLTQFLFVVITLAAVTVNLSFAQLAVDNPTDKKAQGLTVPSVVEHVIPVKSFDMVIASSDGKELVKKTGEIPRGGC